MINAETSAMCFVMKEKKKKMIMQNQAVFIAKQNRMELITKRNQAIVTKKKEDLKRRKKLLKLWCEDDYISTISARALCPEIELQNELAELLLKKGSK